MRPRRRWSKTKKKERKEIDAGGAALLFEENPFWKVIGADLCSVHALFLPLLFFSHKGENLLYGTGRPSKNMWEFPVHCFLVGSFTFTAASYGIKKCAKTFVAVLYYDPFPLSLLGGAELTFAKQKHSFPTADRPTDRPGEKRRRVWMERGGSRTRKRGGKGGLSHTKA